MEQFGIFFTIVATIMTTSTYPLEKFAKVKSQTDLSKNTDGSDFKMINFEQTFTLPQRCLFSWNAFFDTNILPSMTQDR